MGESKVNTRLEDRIILYHGSLNELNENHPTGKFKIAPEMSFTARINIPRINGQIAENLEKPIEALRRKLDNKGYAGLVNLHSDLQPAVEQRVERYGTDFGQMNLYENEFYFVEGTPIVRQLQDPQ